MHKRVCPSFFTGGLAVNDESEEIRLPGADCVNYDYGGEGGEGEGEGEGEDEGGGAMNAYNHDGLNSDAGDPHVYNNDRFQDSQPPLPTTPYDHQTMPSPHKKPRRLRKSCQNEVLIFARKRVGKSSGKSSREQTIPISIRLEEVMSFKGLKTVCQMATYYGISRSSMKKCFRTLGLETWD
jgi:hypothetical protein